MTDAYSFYQSRFHRHIDYAWTARIQPPPIAIREWMYYAMSRSSVVQVARNVRIAVQLSTVLLCISAAITTFAQDEAPDFRVGVRSALVWDGNLPGDKVSSTVLDPLTGHEIHKLSQGGVEVSSRMGYERVRKGNAEKFLNYTTTIANNTNNDLIIRYGAVNVDGHAALLLPVVLGNKGLPKHVRQNAWDLGKMHCFKTGFASTDNYFSGDALSKTFTVRPQTAITISAVTKDPRSYSVQCSLEGCQITGTVRYYINVSGKDYVFVWSGRSITYCGD